MNWGWRIALFYGGFVLFILGMVYASVREDFDLVADNYYEQEVAYQQRIDQMTNARNAGEAVTISASDSGYTLSFAAEAKDVKVHVFRPSDAEKDVLMEAALVNDAMVIPSERLSRGKYQVKVEWKSNGKTMFQETNLFVN